MLRLDGRARRKARGDPRGDRKSLATGNGWGLPFVSGVGGELSMGLGGWRGGRGQTSSCLAKNLRLKSSSSSFFALLPPPNPNILTFAPLVLTCFLSCYYSTTHSAMCPPSVAISPHRRSSNILDIRVRSAFSAPRLLDLARTVSSRVLSSQWSRVSSLGSLSAHRCKSTFRTWDKT